MHPWIYDLDQSELHWTDACENPLNTCCLQAEYPLEQACKHRPVVSQNRVITILKKRGLLDFDLLAGDAAAIEAAAHHPIDAAVAVIGAAVAILAEGAAEFGNYGEDGVSPSRRSDFFRKPSERAAEFTQSIREVAGGRALVDVGIPAADVDKAQVELLAHQPADPTRGS